MSKIEVVSGDITEMEVDVIVNAANASLLGGGGVDGAIHRKAGPELLEECKTLNGCDSGDAKITKGYNLTAKYVIHTVGPVWYGGINNEEEALISCYSRSLQIALEKGLKTIAFPNISTGVYRFPKDKAAKIAITEARNFIKNTPEFEKIIFVAFDSENYEIYDSILKEMENN